MGIVRGSIILNFGISERLRAFRYPIFMGGVVEGDDICSAAFCESAALRRKLLPAFSRLNPLSPLPLVASSSPRRGSFGYLPVSTKSSPFGRAGAGAPERVCRPLWGSWQSRQALTERASLLTKKAAATRILHTQKEPLHMVPCSGSFFMIAYFRLNFSGSKSGSSQKRVMISVRSFRIALECSKCAARPPSLVLTVQPSLD